MTWRKKFFRFLKEEGVYSEWIYNIYEQHPIWDNEFWEKMWENEVLSEDKKCAGGISSAFCWDSTKQGYNFWMKLDIKWNTAIIRYGLERNILTFSKRRRSI